MLSKCLSVLYSCKTQPQLWYARKYLELARKQKVITDDMYFDILRPEFDRLLFQELKGSVAE